MAGTIQAGTLISSNSRSIDVDDIGVRSYAGGGGAFNYRNKIVDGRFDFWYEGTSQTSSGYGSDTMWINANKGSTKVHSRQTLIPGVDLPATDCPSAKYFSRTVVTSLAGVGNYAYKIHSIESVRTLAGKTVTLSFYAKADSAKSMTFDFYQAFGTGGSSSIGGIGATKFNLTTSWQRFTTTFTVPSVSGKTIATDGSDKCTLNFWFDADLTTFSTRTLSLGQQSGTFDIACVQLEEGSVATPFEELPIEVSEMRVSRYYQRIDYGTDLAVAFISTDTATTQMLELRSIMRCQPTCSVVRINNGIVKCITAAGAYTAYTPSKTEVIYVTDTNFLLRFTIAAAAAYSAYVSQFIGYVIADARV